MTRARVVQIVLRLALGLSLTLSTLAAAESCKVAGLMTHTGNVRDTLVTRTSIWVASSGSLEEFDRKTAALKRKYTSMNGLPASQVLSLSASRGGSIEAVVDGATCTLAGDRFFCESSEKHVPIARVRFSYHQGARVTAQTLVDGKVLVGTAGAGAYLGESRLGRESLPGSHVTSLAVHQDRLWVGTFTGGLAREDGSGMLRPHQGPGQLINALLSGPVHLFVGTSDGLYRTRDGSRFERVSIVEDAVVGLAFDGTSVWAATPGALYRVHDGDGPPSDAWWLPGGSRSLQKLSAVPGSVWMGTEDRGAIHMSVGPRTSAKDKPFSVYDRSRGLASSWSLAVAARSDGGAFMTTLREGLSLVRVSGDSARELLTPELNPWGLSALAVPGGAWIGTQGGAAFVSDEGATALIEGLPDPRVHAFLIDTRETYRGRLWIGTENGLAWCLPS